ncbi:MAG: class I SAM-dependent methyltransferase [Pseudomonadota bacterium]
MLRLFKKKKPKQKKAFVSSEYWENRYREGRNSGAGSYGRLAAYKADYLNDFVTRHGVNSVIEFGCGDSAQLSLYDFPTYAGVDVSPSAVAMCAERFAGTSAWSFHHTDNPHGYDETFDLAISIDVIYHLIEDAVFDRYMTDLFDHAGRFVVIYASDKDASTPNEHVRHRKFSDWIAAQRPDWLEIDRAEHPYPFDPEDPDNTSFARFVAYEKVSA